MKKSKFDMVYESIKEDLKKRLFMEDAETEQEDPALEDDMATEDDMAAEEAEDQETDDMATEEDEFSDDEIDEEDEESEDPELVKEFLDNMQIDARGAASGNDVKITAM